MLIKNYIFIEGPKQRKYFTVLHWLWKVFNGSFEKKQFESNSTTGLTQLPLFFLLFGRWIYFWSFGAPTRLSTCHSYVIRNKSKKER